MDRVFITLLVFVPISFLAQYLGATPLHLFIFSGLAIIPLAKFLSDATEDIAAQSGSAIGGLLNATFGNAPELIIGVLAISTGLIDVVKASIVGSILGNLLFVLGLAAYMGGLRHREQTFNQKGTRVSASVFLLAAAALVVPAIFFLTTGVDGVVSQSLSLAVAFLLLVGYVASLIFSLHTHRHLYATEVSPEGAKRSHALNLLIMTIATVAVAFMSKILVDSITPVLTTLAWSQVFVGAIVIAIIGNAAEHVSAVRAAMKNHMDLAISITLGSATQILLLVAPVLVIVGALLGTAMDLVFPAFELVALVFAIFVTNAVLEDGETNWFEGFQLLIVYAIVAVSFFFHP